MMRDLDEEELAEILKAIANPIRIRILELCMLREMSGPEIRRILGISKPLFVSHVKKLLSKGLLKSRTVFDEKKGIVRKYYYVGEWEIPVRKEIEKMARKLRIPHTSAGSKT